MKVNKLSLGNMEANCYIVENGSECIIIDAGGHNPKPIEDLIAANNLKINGLLLTHGHFDHASLGKYFQQKGIKVYIHNDDADKLYTHKNLSLMIGENFDKYHADILFNGDITLSLAGLKIQVLHTPGHTEGGVCYIIEDAIFCGDTIMHLSYGRTDFPDGSFNQLKQSISKLFALKGDYTLYCGHGDNSSLDFERRCNPIFIDKND